LHGENRLDQLTENSRHLATATIRSITWPSAPLLETILPDEKVIAQRRKLARNPSRVK
jgi:hypothetical protein